MFVLRHQVNATNGAGYVISNMRSVTMPPGAPDGLLPPVLRAQSPYTILITWKDPARNNAPGDAVFQLQHRLAAPPHAEKNLLNGITREMSFELTGNIEIGRSACGSL